MSQPVPQRKSKLSNFTKGFKSKFLPSNGKGSHPSPPGVQVLTNAQHVTMKDNVTIIAAGRDFHQHLNDPDSTELNGMVCAQGTGYNMTKMCLPNTRTEVLKEITEWANSVGKDIPPIFWLSGVAGAGKSAIAHTIAFQFDQAQMLGSFFCFDRAFDTERRHEKIFSTIARDLAICDSGIKTALAAVIRKNPILKSTPDIIQQWEKLLVEPAKHISTNKPCLLVIEALDESGDSKSRKNLLSILSQQAKELPSNIRILLTSRGLVDIVQSFNKSSFVYSKSLSDIPAFSVKSDIFAFVKSALTGVDDKFFDNEKLNVLSTHADGLFQWAFLACDFIKQDDSGGLTSKELYDSIVQAMPNGQPRERLLDDMYTKILDKVVLQHKQALDRFQSIMGLILSLFEPLSLDALNELSSMECGVIIKHMGSLLSGVADSSSSICLLHSSFRDYLTDHSRSDIFYVDLSEQHNHLAMLTLKIMQSKLQFNICGLESSYLYNSDIMDLNERIQKFIPNSLIYSCQYWAKHLEAAEFEQSLVNAVERILYNYFLFWLEVLSLLQVVNIASPAMASVAKWMTKHNISKEIVEFARDAQKFIRVFGRMMLESTPHLYLSGLGFAPETSIIYQQFQNQFKRIVCVATGRMTMWPSLENELHGHTDRVTSVVFSSDGRHIISGSEDMTIRIWDAETGNTLLFPLKGHTDKVTSIALSLDGKKIISGSADKTVRIWDANTGNALLFPLKGHTDRVTSVAFSSDENHIISGSADNIVRIWDAKTGNALLSLLKGYTDKITSVASSPKSKYFISGLGDNTVRIWDTETENTFHSSLEESDWITSVAFSPDGKYIVLGLANNTARIWNIETKNALPFSLKGHTDWVTSIAFSSNGKYIVSGSDDNTIRIWDADTGNALLSPLKGHTDKVKSVSFSPDGKHIASGSNDNTVRIWNVEAENISLFPLEEHSDWVTSVMFSPNGKHIISASYDNTVRIWDAKTGNAWLSPIKGHAEPVTSIAFLSNEKHIVSGSGDNTVKIWDAEKENTLLSSLEEHTDWINSVACSLDGKYIASGSNDNTVKIWDIKTENALLFSLEGHTDWVTSVAFSLDGTYIASGSHDNTVRVWEVKTGNILLAPLEGHTGWVTSVAFSSDKKHIVSGSYDKTLRIWNIVTGNAFLSSLTGHMGPVTSVAFSPDGKHIASGSGDNTVRIWNAETGNALLFPLKGHSLPVTSVAFSPDNKYVVSGSHDRTIRIWDVKTENTLLRFSSKPSHALYFAYKNILVSYKFLPDSIQIDNNGWISDSYNQLLLWIPPINLPHLHYPRLKQIMGTPGTQLDLSLFVHGKSWQQCYEPVK